MIQSIQLGNGVTVICENRPKTGKVTMQIALRNGAAQEAFEQAGLTNLAQEICWGGSKTRSRDDIADAIESLGGSYSSDAGRGQTWFAAQSLARDTAAVFTIVADAIRNPAFDPEEIEITKEQIKTGIEQRDQKASALASKSLMEAAFAGQPAGNHPHGTQDGIDSFTPTQIRDRHAELLAHPEDIIISFAGDIDMATAQALGNATFGDLKGQGSAANPPLEFKGGDIRIPQNNEQLNISFGFAAPAATDTKRFHMNLLEELLAGGMSSPLFQEIREKRGLVYSVGASFVPLRANGIFSVTAGTGRGNARELLSTTFALLGDLARTGFTQEQMDKACERIIRGLKGSLESDFMAARNNSAQVVTHGRLISLDEYEESLRKVTSADVQNAIGDLLRSGTYALGAVGPQDNMPDEAEIKAMMAEQAKTLTPPAQNIATSTTTTAVQQDNAPQTDIAEPKVTTLKNGMKVVTAERPGSLACGAWVGAGSDHETPELSGATHMNEHMMFKGTPSYGPSQIDRIIESSLGGGLNAYTSNDKTAYYFYNLLPRDIEQIVDICGEMVFQANLDHNEYDGHVTTNTDGTTTKNKGERDVVLEEIKRANDNISSRMWGLLNKTAYGDQPHARAVLGTEQTLRAMSVDMLAAYRDAYYTPNNVVFSAAGPVKHEDFVALIERKFGSMPSVPFAPLPEQKAGGGVAYEEMESAQLCQISLAMKGVSEIHPDHEAYEALGAVLAGGGSSRLYKIFVNQTSLTNNVGAGAISYQHCGQFGVFLSTRADRTKEAVQTIYNELRAVTKNLTNAELNKVKAQMEMDALSSIETNNDACDTYGQDVLARGKVETTAEICARIQKLTLSDIKRVAKDILAADPAFVGVVPQGTDRSLLPTHQEVLAFRDSTGPAAVKKNRPQPEI